MHVSMHKYECMHLLAYLLTYLFTYLLIYLLTYLLTYLPTYLPYQKFDRLVTGTYQKPHPQGAESMQKLLQPQMLARQSDRSAPERPQRHSRDTQNGSHWIRKHLQMIGIFLKSNKYNYIYIHIYLCIYLLANYVSQIQWHPPYGSISFQNHPSRSKTDDQINTDMISLLISRCHGHYLVM